MNLANKQLCRGTASYLSLSYIAVLIISSLYPFSGWRTTGIPLFDFYSYPLPYYQTATDNIVNLIAYFPLGVAISFYTKKPLTAIGLAFFSSLCLSSTVEFIQQFLPRRIASNLDIINNTLGALLGVICARFIPSGFIKKYLVFRHKWMGENRWAEVGMVWLILWICIQVNPTTPLFSLNDARIGWLTHLENPLLNSALFVVLLEMSQSFLHIISIALFASCAVSSFQAIIFIIWFVFFLGFIFKIATVIIIFNFESFFIWLSFNSLISGISAIFALTVFIKLSLPYRALIGAGALILNTIISARWPMWPTFDAIPGILDGNYSHLLHLPVLINAIIAVWPYGALVILAGIRRASNNEQVYV